MNMHCTASWWIRNLQHRPVLVDDWPQGSRVWEASRDEVVRWFSLPGQALLKGVCPKLCGPETSVD